MRILVCGATGKVGGGVVKLLNGAPVVVRALVRDPAKARFPDGVEVVTADYGDPASMDAAVAGVDGVFIMAPIAHLVANTRTIAAAAQRGGAPHLVLLSSLSVEADDNEHAALHKTAEQAVMGSGCPWTILRGGQFMSNTLRWADAVRSAREVRPYIRDQATAIIHPADISAMAVKALTETGHYGKIYGLTGGEPVKPSECARILSDALGFDVRYVELTDDEAEQCYVELFEDTLEVRAKLRSLREPDVPWERVRPDVEQVLGRLPLTYARWARENVDAFR
jgi:(4-alkanoyl-5-oxo-2,5-dihydrofuran-3-yl)methyl phosphate reductase